jgi:putative ABC transport system permease protein
MKLAALWRNLFHRTRVECDLNDETSAYFEALVDEKTRAGASRDAARRAAAIEMGGAEQVKEEVRDARAGALLEALWSDVRYGLRVLRKSPGYTVATVLVLALGIGANTAIFSVVYGVLFRPLPYPQDDRIAVIFDHFAPQNNPRGHLCLADYFDLKARQRSFSEIGVFAGNRFDLTGVDEPEQITGAAVTSGFFEALETPPLAGRFILPEDDAPNATPVVVLSESLWKRRFGGDRAAVGHSVILSAGTAASTLGGVSRTIVGVMPDSFRMPRSETALWVNLRPATPSRRGPFFYSGIGRLKPGVSFEQAQAETNAIGQDIERANSKTYQHLKMPVVALREAMVGNTRSSLEVLLGAVLFVLLIATVNVANLSLARAGARQREMAVRGSLGARRGRLIRQLLTESLLLAAAGGVVGTALASWGIATVRALNPGNLPRIQDVQLDWRVLAFSGAIALAAGILAGLAPALEASRSSINSALNTVGRGGTSGMARRRTLAAFVVAETALSLVLLTGAGLLLRSFLLLQQVPTGLDAPLDRILTMRVSISGKQYSDARQQDAFFRRVADRARQIPGVESASLSDSLPPDRSTNDDTFTIEGQLLAPGQSNPSTQNTRITADYFRALGIPLRQGRWFTDSDVFGAPYVALISESMARRYFPGETPLGQRIKESGPDLTSLPFREIVGVVGDVKYEGLDRDTSSAYYLSFWQDQGVGTANFLTVRTSAPAAGLAESISREIRRMEPNIILSEVGTMEEAISDSVAQPRFRTTLIGAFALLALLLAAVGIYGVIAYSVSQRTQEIGVRMALGARRIDVLRMVLGESAMLAAVGIVMGLAGAFALTRLLAGLLFAVQPTDPPTFVAVSLLLAAVSVCAGFFPARRATRIDPLTALRWD